MPTQPSMVISLPPRSLLPSSESSWSRGVQIEGWESAIFVLTVAGSRSGRLTVCKGSVCADRFEEGVAEDAVGFGRT